MKNKYSQSLLKQLMGTTTLKIITIITAISSIYAIGHLAIGKSYIMGYIHILGNPLYQIIAFFLVALFVTTNVFKQFEKNTFYLIRLSNTKDYLKKMLRNILFVNSIIFLVSNLIILIGLNLVCGNNFGVGQLINGISNIIYLIYFIFKIYLLIIFISAINVLLLKLFNQRMVILANLFLYASFFEVPYLAGVVISSALYMPWHIVRYTTIIQYNNFVTEILCFIIYIGILYIIAQILFQLVVKYMKKVGD